MPGDRRQILSLLRLPIPPLQHTRNNQFNTPRRIAQLRYSPFDILPWFEQLRLRSGAAGCIPPATGRRLRTMKRSWIFGVAGLLLVTFGLGFLAGTRRRPMPRVDALPPLSLPPLSLPPANAPASAASSTDACMNIQEASTQVGKTGCVAAQVLRVYTSRGGNTFLDFCQDYRGCPFTSVIFAADKSKFGDLESLQGRHVEIRGAITLYQNRAEVIIRDPQQIRNAP